MLEAIRVDAGDFGIEPSASSNEGKGKLQQLCRWRRRPRDGPVEALPKGRIMRQLFRPPSEHPDIGQRQAAGHVLEEGSFALIRLQQGELDLRKGECQGNRRQTAAAAD